MSRRLLSALLLADWIVRQSTVVHHYGVMDGFVFIDCILVSPWTASFSLAKPCRVFLTAAA